jgi:glycolate oxidase FAD binding subunit
MSDIMRPATEWELKSMMMALTERAIPVEILGAGSKRGIGRPVVTPVALTTGAMRGISLYEPSELVMAARAGTPLSQIEVELASRGQMLPFEPIDLGPTLGTDAGLQTIGAIFAGNLSGSRRISAGAARDYLLGVRGVNGHAEIFKSGGRVMKNVTGYDVARGLAGSWGTLAVLTEVTFKVLPLPDDVATLIYPDLTDDLAVELMSLAMTQPFEVSGTVHLSPTLASRLKHRSLGKELRSLTAIRLENFTRSITYRKQKLREILSAYGAPLELELESSLEFWSEVRRLSFLPPNGTHVWRISTTPSAAPALVASIRRHMKVEAFYDWSGGLVWLETPASADAGSADIRRAVATHGGHATLIRADETVRRTVEVFQPLGPAVDRITRGIKQAFDPLRLLNPGRMYATM